MILRRRLEARSGRSHGGAGARGQFPAGGAGFAKDGSDLAKFVPEHVMQQKRRALGGRKLFQRQHECDGHRFIQSGLGGGIVRRRLMKRLGQPYATVAFAPDAGGLEHIQRLTAARGHQPGADIPHLVGADATPAQPCVLHHVLRLGQGANHAVGDALQQAAMLFEELRPLVHHLSLRVIG